MSDRTQSELPRGLGAVSEENVRLQDCGGNDTTVAAVIVHGLGGIQRKMWGAHQLFGPNELAALPGLCEWAATLIARSTE